MVDATRLRKRFEAVPEALRNRSKELLEEEASKIVAQLLALRPLKEIEVGWTWGDAPAGALVIGQVRGNQFGKLVIKIYAVAPKGSGFSARWFEFGTAERFHKSGKSVGAIAESPFFYPVWRANKRAAKARITRELKKTIRGV